MLLFIIGMSYIIGAILFAAINSFFGIDESYIFDLKRDGFPFPVAVVFWFITAPIQIVYILGHTLPKNLRRKIEHNKKELAQKKIEKIRIDFNSIDNYRKNAKNKDYLEIINDHCAKSPLIKTVINGKEELWETEAIYNKLLQ